MTDLETTISNVTGFDAGDMFASEEEVRAYFTVKSMKEMFAERPPSQDTLDEWADAVIENCWHCTWEEELA